MTKKEMFLKLVEELKKRWEALDEETAKLFKYAYCLQERAEKAEQQRDRLLEALQALGSKPQGYCFCLSKKQVEAGHTGECRDAVMAIVAVKSET